MGRNYYISCKMIEVLTARIVRQKTASTKQGADDIVNVAQQLVREMFSLPTQGGEKNAPAQTDPYDGMLSTDGKKVFLNGQLVDKHEVKRLMVNTMALSVYEKGLSQKIWGNVLTIWGVTSLTVGVISALDASSSTEENFPNQYEYEYEYEQHVSVGRTTAVLMMTMGTAELVIGIVLKKQSKRNISQSVHMYNARNRSAQVEYKFGITPHGLGMVVNF